jgi:hypothetical protein
MKRLTLLLAFLILTTTCAGTVGAQVADRPISDAQWQKIRADLDANGTDDRLSANLTMAFGLTHQGERERPSRQLVELHDVKLSPLYFTIAKLPNGNYFISGADGNNANRPKLIRVYYVNKVLELLAAVSATGFNGGSQIPSISSMPNRDAQHGLNAVLKVLADIADKL